ncbi:response regulator transcription factor [Alicyclobacillus vulcanalis]|uniref:Two-component system, OmpR family, response regulator n=1 Tax=Alicyclobacillus vulcanalis TaxID=252246 RepID=A0A1N7NZY1_9BACL|nr:response regulator transcription factor [Alicyclobacillus vulcanalis]SIT03925.1 two-component system, OmpR family, response regulator [Alicyclobacillus vulcanalis]
MPLDKQTQLYDPSKIRILVVDDEPSIVKFLEFGLRREGYAVQTAADGVEAIAKARDAMPHVCILDVMMPGPDGFEVCKMLKRMGHVAVILLTARDAIDDRVKGLMGGADDYVVKPFSFEELLARIHARVRSQFPQLLQQQEIGPFLIDDARKEIAFHGNPLKLSSTEYELLRYLVQNHGLVLSKAQILDHVWGYDFNGQDNIVEVYISALREKLGDRDRTLIRTLRGQGYRVDLP